MAKDKNTNSYERVKKPKKETILIEIISDKTVLSQVDNELYVNGFKFIEGVLKYGKTYAKCYNKIN